MSLTPLQRVGVRSNRDSCVAMFECDLTCEGTAIVGA